MDVKEDNYGFYLLFTVYENDGTTVRNLTGYTITLKVWTPVSGTVKFTGACTIVSAVAGTCKYLVTATDFNTAGIYAGELELTTAAPSVEDTETFTINVVPTAP